MLVCGGKTNARRMNDWKQIQQYNSQHLLLSHGPKWNQLQLHHPWQRHETFLGWRFCLLLQQFTPRLNHPYT